MGRGRSGDLSAALCYQRSMAPASQGGIGDGCAGLPCKAETDSMSLDKLGKIGYYSKRMVQDSGFRIQDSGFRIQDSGFRIQDSGVRSQGPEKNFDDASARASVATNCFTPSGQDVA